MIHIAPSLLLDVGYLRQTIVETRNADVAYLVIDNRGQQFLRDDSAKMTLKILQPKKVFVPVVKAPKVDASTGVAVSIKKKYDYIARSIGAHPHKYSYFKGSIGRFWSSEYINLISPHRCMDRLIEEVKAIAREKGMFNYTHIFSTEVSLLCFTCHTCGSIMFLCFH